ncbi:MAG TPA: transcription elongation factor GreA [Candidatus Nitrosocosmicus sp.]|nr:transcription elongation factor GreA [Candidatus Nitrosocosmicus sp.]
MSNIKFTKEGLEKVQTEHNELQEKRKEAVQLLKTAREMGDLSENSAYRAAKWKLSSIDSRLRHLDMLLRNGRVVDTREGVVDIGSTVVVNDGKQDLTISIVGGFESDVMNGKISHNSPLGKALFGKKENEEVVLKAPSGTRLYKIIRIV